MPIDLTPIVKPLNDLAEPVTNSISDAWSAVLGDRIAAWRLRNAAATQAKLHDELKRLGVSLDNAKIPERYAFAWFEEATKQDEPEIQELFARLLAKAAAGDKDANDRRNLEILTRMTPMDAQVMAFVLTRFNGEKYATLDTEYAIWSLTLKEFGPNGELALEHLVNLGILEKQYCMAGSSYTGRMASGTSGLSLGAIVEHINQNTEVRCDLAASERGWSLFRACEGAPSGNRPQSNPSAHSPSL